MRYEFYVYSPFIRPLHEDTFDRLEEYVNEADISEKLVVSRGNLTPLSINIVLVSGN
jgi:hypothetical protein